MSLNRPTSAGLRLFAALAATVLITALAPAAASAITPPPASDPFYPPPAGYQNDAPGTILRERPVSTAAPQSADTAAAYQLMFRTTTLTGAPAAGVTTVLVPAAPAAGPRRLATYETAYDSLTLSCAPSDTLQEPDQAEQEHGYIAAELAEGWDVNIPDYEGLQSEWAVGPELGRVSLDSVKAAENFAAAGLSGDRTEVTFNGYSGGSEASTWAAALAPRYAPSLDIVGIAAGGEFPNLSYTFRRFDYSTWYGTEIGVLVSYSRAYPQQINLSTLLNPAGQALAAGDAEDASGCAGSTLNAIGGNAAQYTNFPTSQALVADPPVHQVLRAVSLDRAPLPKTPEFLYNSVEDDLAYVPPVDALVRSYCARGVTVDYDRDPTGGDHLQGFVKYFPPALAYLKARFAGTPAPDHRTRRGAAGGDRGAAGAALQGGHPRLPADHRRDPAARRLRRLARGAADRRRQSGQRRHAGAGGPGEHPRGRRAPGARAHLVGVVPARGSAARPDAVGDADGVRRPRRARGARGGARARRAACWSTSTCSRSPPPRAT